MEREFTEWTNSWWDDANNPKKRRWLMIGDSVHRECRSTLQHLLRPIQISLDFYAASFHIEDDAFKREIKHFFSYDEYEYEIIFVGWGGHHGYARRTIQEIGIREAYKNSYQELLEFVMKRCLLAVILLSTPVTTEGNVKLFDSSINSEVVERNLIAKELAEKYDLPFIDQYQLVMNHQEQIEYRDTKHFIGPSYLFIVQDTLNYLKKNEILKDDGQLSDKVRKTNGVSLRQIIKDNAQENSGDATNNFCGNCMRSEIFWLMQYQYVAADVDWLPIKSIGSSNTSAEVGYAYLYILIRLLEEYHPKNILEFNIGQVTKISAQYASTHSAKLTVLDHDRSRVEYLLHKWPIDWSGTEIHGAPLMDAQGYGISGWYYRNFQNVTDGKRYNVFLLKCPRGGDRCIKPHLDIMTKLLELIADDFAILIDHVEDEAVNKVYKRMKEIFEEHGIVYRNAIFSSTDRKVGLFVSESWRYAEEY